MKKNSFLLIALVFATHFSFAQWISRGSNIYYNSGNVGIGSTNPSQKLTVNGGGIGFDWNATDKKLYSPTDGDLEWMTHNAATAHGFAVSHQGTKMVYLNTSGNSYFNGGNLGIGTTMPTYNLDVKGVTTSELQLTDIGDVGMQFTANGSTNIFSLRNSGAIMYLSTANSYGLMIGTNSSSNPLLASSNGLYINSSGNIGIGTTIPDTKLAVVGTIHANEVKIDLSVPAPDYVFESTYKLPKLNELKDYLDKNHHLPEIPSAGQMAKDGINLGDMNIKLLKKVEELTLYLIKKEEQVSDQDKQLADQKKQITAQGKKIEDQQQVNQSLQEQINELAKKLNK